MWQVSVPDECVCVCGGGGGSGGGGGWGAHVRRRMRYLRRCSVCVCYLNILVMSVLVEQTSEVTFLHIAA